ncbi:MAG: cell division/cell wall cluster transcriptional repressor MraZ [Candidatus Nealsonbacteria bacterium RIFOXYB1_FULL_40_15]|uniref:Transcriptional regulator MraZ n=2 Tax=Candidatus Nealsoniibacteriota TaxID=1817911 RepID=A0A1G2ENL6_9BACT|nr:MAG: cell division/cell wall cluster transcriptional repressor MraZ [Candidatus Nealsonbacteria bacterium RIFOXYC1_FULL_40_7]OGZ27732.1 MAG: cell division/cell wall cluster transcriptional repressor MraZ [Candidatus Nealsonbacteria bacterium RIFOXYB1_FULL_40_15]OGZ29542.1 MAG: cell division/cell wall cluster transcriptional repressor MraZ [Candidatus Nealsonbacteria bacterium RIFOXYD1_FULL_39_11]
MFIGEYNHSIDEKKRLSLPAKFRKELGGKVIVTRGFDNCLVVYSKGKWGQVMEEMKKISSNRAEGRMFSRFILGGAAEVELDKLGRVLIPDYLKQYAGLKKEIVVCGLSDKLEIWDSEKWQGYKSGNEKNIDKLAENLPELGI